MNINNNLNEKTIKFKRYILQNMYSSLVNYKI